jgi:signal transduction histidine kinase
MLIVAVWIHHAARRDLIGALDRTLLVTARGVEAALTLELDGTIELDLESGSALEFEDSENAFYVVTQAGGEVFASSLAAHPPRVIGSDSKPTCADVKLAGNGFRVCTLAIVTEPGSDPEDIAAWEEEHPGQSLPDVDPVPFWVTVGRSMSDVEEAQAALRRRLLFGFGALFVALMLLPAGIVSWALHSLRNLSAEAQNLGPDTPQARLSEEGIDREVHSVVTAFNRALDRLAAAYEHQRRFSADAAHELRTPIAAIRTNCEVALRTEHDLSQLREALAAIHCTVLRMGGTVENLLALGRFQDHASVQMAPTDLGSVAHEAVSLNAPAARAKQVHLTISAPKRVMVKGNEDFLVECVSNLVENAIRHTPPEGYVRVATGNFAHPFIAVEDTGMGIPKEHLDKIFDRFYRVDRSRSRKEGGSGLGLSIAQEIARLHGGEIQTESRVGKGSRFTLTFRERPSDFSGT